MHLETRIARLLAGLAIVLACAAGPGARCATLILHPSTPLVTPGSRLALRLEALDNTGAPLPLGPVAWSVAGGSGTATISPDGMLAGVGVGTITVTAMANGATLTAPGFVLSPTDSLRVSTPLVEAAAKTPVYIPLILSSSPAFTDASVSLRLVSDDSMAPPLTPAAVVPPDGATLGSENAFAGGLQFSIHWMLPVRGPAVLANLRIDPPANLARDTTYRVMISSASLSDATGATLLVASDTGTLILGATSPGALTQISVTPAQATVYSSQTVDFNAAGADALGNAVPLSTVNWSVEPPGLGSISSAGVFQPAATGTGTIRAVSGSVSGTASVTVLGGQAPLPESVVAPAVTGPAGAIVELPILLGSLKGLAGMEFTVTVVVPPGAPPLTDLDPVTGPLATGAFLGGSLQADGTQKVALLASRDLNGPGVLMNLRFQIPASAPGAIKYGIEINGLDLSDGSGIQIPAAALSGEVDVMADLTPPSVTLAGFTPGLVLSGTVSPSVGATDIDSGITGVDLLVDGAVVSSAKATPYLLSWDTTHSPDGPHMVQVRASDPSGNVGTSPPVSVIVDNTPPTAAITAPLPGAGLKGSVVIMGTAMDSHFLNYRLRAAPMGDPVHPIDVAPSANQPVTAGTLATWDTRSLPDGPYLLHLIVEDQAHNLTDLPVPVVLANTPPVLQFANPPSTAVRGKVVLTVASSEPLSEVDFSVDGSAPMHVTAVPATLTLDTTALSDGPHTVKASGLNTAGVPGDVSLALLADNTAPATAIVSPADGGAVRGTVPIQLTVSDITPVAVTIDAGAGVSPPSFAPIGTLSLSPGAVPDPVQWTTTGLPDGLYVLRVTAVDAAGNATQAVANITVDNTLPDLLVYSPKGDVWASNSLDLDIEAADTGGLASITAAVDGKEIARSSTAQLSRFADLTGIPEGPHMLTLSATDRAGNVESIVVPLTVDRTPPAARIEFPLPNAALSGDVTLIGTTTDPAPGDVASYRLDIGSGGDPTAWQTLFTGQGAHHSEPLGNFNTSTIPTGGYILRLVAVDRAGNTTESRVKVYIGSIGLPGDLDFNGKVDVIDATRALTAVVGLITLSDRQIAAADLDHNGKVDIGDVIRILRIAVGLE